MVRRCIEQLHNLHPDWKIHLLDAENVYEYIEPLPVKEEVLSKMILAHRSDLIRTQLLIRHGGVWADPTVYCVEPLDEWLPEKMESGLFLFSRPGRDRIISNWFIAAEPGNHLLIQLYGDLCDYWNRYPFRNLGRKEKSKTEYWLNRIINRNLDWPRIWFSPVMTRLLKLYPYMVYHYKFYDLIKRDQDCKIIWRMMDKISANPQAKLKRYGLIKPVNEELKKHIDEKKCLVHKLTWKLNMKENSQYSVLNYLLNKS